MMMMMSCFCGVVDRRKAFTPYFQPGTLSEILTIANHRHDVSKVWTCAESEFRLCWKLCSSDNHYTSVRNYPQVFYKGVLKNFAHTKTPVPKSLFLIKLLPGGFNPATLLKIIPTQEVSCEVFEILIFETFFTVWH